MVVGGQRHAPSALPPVKTRYPRIGGRVDPTDGLDWCGKSRPHWDSIPGPSRRSESLYRLSYPGRYSGQRPVLEFPPTLRTYLHLNTCVIRRTSGRSLQISGVIGEKRISLFYPDAWHIKAVPITTTKGPVFTFYRFHFSAVRQAQSRWPAAQSIPSPGSHARTHTETTQIMRACLPSRVLRSLQCTELGPGNAKTC